MSETPERTLRDPLADRARLLDSWSRALAARREDLQRERGAFGPADDSTPGSLDGRLHALLEGEIRGLLIAAELHRIEEIEGALAGHLGRLEALRSAPGAPGDRDRIAFDLTLVVDALGDSDLSDLFPTGAPRGLDPLRRWEAFEVARSAALRPDVGMAELEEAFGREWRGFVDAGPGEKLERIADLLTRGAVPRPQGSHGAHRTFQALHGEAGEQAAQRAGVPAAILEHVRAKATIRQLVALHTRGPTAVRSLQQLYFTLGSIEHFKVLEVLMGSRFVVPYRVWRAGLVIRILRLLRGHYPSVKIAVTGSVGIRGLLRKRTPSQRRRELDTAKDLDITITGHGQVGRAQLSLERLFRSLFGDGWIRELDMTLFGDPRMAMEEPLTRLLTRELGRSRAASRLRKRIRGWVDEALAAYDQHARREVRLRNRDILAEAWGVERTRGWYEDRGWAWPDDTPDREATATGPLDPEARARHLEELDDLRARMAARGARLVQLDKRGQPDTEEVGAFRSDLGDYAKVYHRLMAGTPGAYVLRGTRKLWVIDREAILPRFSDNTSSTHDDNVLEHFGLGWRYTTPGHVDVIKAAKYWPRLLESRGEAVSSLPSGKNVEALIQVAAEIKAAKDAAAADANLTSFYDLPADAATLAFVEDLQSAGAAVVEDRFGVCSREKEGACTG